MSQRPILPYVLGIAGLIPFVGLALYSVICDGNASHSASVLLLSYGAVILSFLGGSRWGAEIQKNRISPTA